jgi:hypothetical protein
MLVVREYHFGKSVEYVHEFYPPFRFEVIHKDWHQVVYNVYEFKVDACLQIQALRDKSQYLILQEDLLLNEEIAHADISKQPDAILSNFHIFLRFIAESDFILWKLMSLLTFSFKLIIASFDLLITHLNTFSSLSDNIAFLFKESVCVTIWETA